MRLNSDDILFNAFRAFGPAASKEAGSNPEKYRYWTKFTDGLMITAFCHLIETQHGGKDTFKQTLKTAEHKHLTDLLFIIRNAFVHCNWDVSKLDFENQKTKIRDSVSSGSYEPNIASFKLWLDSDIIKLEGLEPACRVLLKNV